MDLKADKRYLDWESDIRFVVIYDRFSVSGKWQWIVIAHFDNRIVEAATTDIYDEVTLHSAWKTLKEHANNGAIWMTFGHPDEAMDSIMKQLHEYYTKTFLSNS